MSNKPCLTKPTVTHSNIDEEHPYPFVVSLYSCNESWIFWLSN